MMGDKGLKQLDSTLRASFGAIKEDMLLLKQASQNQQHMIDSVAEEVMGFKDMAVSRNEFERVQQMQTEGLQKIASLVEVLNNRIEQVNEQYVEVLSIREEIKKMHELKTELSVTKEEITAELRRIERAAVTEKQVEKLVADVNKEFDKIKKKIS